MLRSIFACGLFVAALSTIGCGPNNDTYVIEKPEMTKEELAAADAAYAENDQKAREAMN